MPRCIVHILGLSFCLLFSAGSVAHAQILQGPVQTQVPHPNQIEITVPSIEAPNVERKVELQYSPNTGLPRGDTWQYKRVYTLAELALMSSEYTDCRYVANSQYPDECGLWENLCVGSSDQFHRLWNDTKNFYSCDNMLCVGLVVGMAAPLANTQADQRLRDWYQRQARRGQSDFADNFSDVGKFFGEHLYTVPALLAMSVGGHLFPDHALLSPLGNFSDRSLRALAIGAPTVGVLQIGLGGQRPDANDSYWHPFKYGRGASGHAFVGAVPFLTAASMTESRALKALLFAGSFWTGWSRIHDDDHYFSQVLIGWSIAYLATEAVNRTENENFRIIPMAFPNGMGMGVHIQY